MNDIVALSDELYLSEKQRSEAVEENTKSKDTTLQDFNEGYRSEKIKAEEKRI